MVEWCKRIWLTVNADQRKAGECTCSRAPTENKGIEGEGCACGKRAKGELIFLYLTATSSTTSHCFC